MDCRDRLPQSFIDALCRRVNAGPTGVWRDFNEDHRDWEWLSSLPYTSNMFCPEDVPEPEPDPAAYSADLDSPATK